MSLVRIGVGVLIASATICGPSLVHAQAPFPGVTLAWTRGEGADACPTGGAVHDLVRARLGRDPFQSPIAQSIEVLVTGNGSTYSAQLFVRGFAGEPAARRELNSASADCHAITDAAVLAIAIAIDPEAALRPRESSSPPPASESPSASPTPGSAEPPTRVEPLEWTPISAAPLIAEPPREPHVVPPRTSDVIAVAGFAYGLLPGLAPSVALHADAWTMGWFRAGAGMTFLPEAGAQSMEHAFAFGLVALELSGCGDFVRNHRMIVSGCAALWLGAIHAVVFDLLPVHIGDRPWAAAAIDARWRITLFDPLAIEFAASAVVPLTRYEFLVDGPVGLVFAQSPVALLAIAGVSVLIP